MALVSNGTNQYSLHTLTTLINTSNAFTIAFTFRTGSVVSGVSQVPLHINRASSFARGFGIEITSAGLIRGFAEIGSRSSTATLGTATANTVYTVVITKNTGVGDAIFYVNSIVNTRTLGNSLNIDLTRIISGAMFSNAYQEYFGGKLGRIAFWPSKLSNLDITICLDNTQTPAACSVTPQDYWIAIANDAATYGSNATVRTGTTYDADVLSASVIDSITDPIESGGTFSFTGTSWSGGTFTSITTSLAGVTVSSIAGTTSSGSAVISGWLDGVVHADIPAAATFTFNDGASTDAIAANISLPTDYTRLPLVNPWVTNTQTIAGAIYAQTGRTLATGDIFYPQLYDGLEIFEDTDWEGDAGTFDLWVRVAAGADAGKMFYYAVTITESGAVVITGTSKNHYIGFGLGIGF